MSLYYHQLAVAQASDDKGPSGRDSFAYIQAQTGPSGARGPPGKKFRIV